ncbi:MAG: ferritin-like domain-containing protein [Acidimicrobiales bacterium]
MPASPRAGLLRPTLAQVAAQSPSSTPGSQPPATTPPIPSSPTPATWPLAYLAGLESVVATAYDVILGSGRLAPAVADLATGFGAHHRDYAKALAAAAGPEGGFSGPNATLAAALAPRVNTAAAAGSDRLVALLSELENNLAATHLHTLATLRSTPGLRLLASIMPVECAQATVLTMSLGRDPRAAIGPGPVEVDSARLDPTSFPAQGPDGSALEQAARPDSPGSENAPGPESGSGATAPTTTRRPGPTTTSPAAPGGTGPTSTATTLPSPSTTATLPAPTTTRRKDGKRDDGSPDTTVGAGT